MEYSRSLGIQGKELQLLIEATQDRMFGVSGLNISGLGADQCLPANARCNSSDGSSTIPGFQSLLIRAIQKSISKVENKIKLYLYPRRKTNLSKTAREVYENRDRFSVGHLNSFITPLSKQYPAWSDLTVEQQGQYLNDQTLYTAGTLPWDLLTDEQKNIFSRGVLFVPNKIGDEERLDGKGKSYIKLHERHVLKIHKLALEIQDPAGLGIPYLNRVYSENEYFLYKKEGGLILFPAQAKISATGNAQAMLNTYGIGLSVPYLPQVVAVDYEFGLQEIPYDLQDAIALFSAIKAFEMLNVLYTQGLSSFSVQGFSAAFGAGLYEKVIERYKQEAEDLLAPYYQLVLTGW